jgi:transcriptional regulator with XRE-family HTH domain
MKGRVQPQLRLVVTNSRTLFGGGGHRSAWSECSRTAASPRGESLRPCSMSLTDDVARPIASPIAESVIPVARKSEIRDAHVVIGSSLRHPVTIMQRHSVTAFRDNLGMSKSVYKQRFETLGARLKHWRKERGLSRPKLSSLSGVPYSTIAEIENEEQHSSTKITQLAAALKLNPHYLATDEGDPLDVKAAPAIKDSQPLFTVDLSDFDEIELELLEFRFKKDVEEIRTKRLTGAPKKRQAKKAG